MGKHIRSARRHRPSPRKHRLFRRTPTRTPSNPTRRNQYHDTLRTGPHPPQLRHQHSLDPHPPLENHPPPLPPRHATSRHDGRRRMRPSHRSLRNAHRPHNSGHADPPNRRPITLPRLRPTRKHNESLLRRRAIPGPLPARVDYNPPSRSRPPHRLGQRGNHRTRRRDGLGACRAGGAWTAV